MFGFNKKPTRPAIVHLLDQMWGDGKVAIFLSEANWGAFYDYLDSQQRLVVPSTDVPGAICYRGFAVGKLNRDSRFTEASAIGNPHDLVAAVCTKRYNAVLERLAGAVCDGLSQIDPAVVDNPALHHANHLIGERDALRIALKSIATEARNTGEESTPGVVSP